MVIWFYFRKILHKNQYVGCKIILTDVWECNKIKRVSSGLRWSLFQLENGIRWSVSRYIQVSDIFRIHIRNFWNNARINQDDKPSSLTSLSSIREKTGIWHVEIDKKFAKNDMTKNFIKHDPNYSLGGYQISKKFWNRFINTDFSNFR